MGAAKRKYDEARAKFLAEIEVWTQPPTDEERRTVAEIEKLPFVTIKRIEPHILDYMGMQPQQCHENAGQYVKMAPPDQNYTAVTGWWRIGDTYVAHSVIANADGDMACITPHPITNTEIDFAPDPRIIWSEDGEYMRAAMADGTKVPQLLRSNPERVIAHQMKIKGRLESGMNPFHAVQLEYVMDDQESHK